MGCVNLYLGGNKTYALGLGTMRAPAYTKLTNYQAFFRFSKIITRRMIVRVLVVFLATNRDFRV